MTKGRSLFRNPEPKEWDANQYCRHKIADYKPFNFVDGEGVRNSIYVSGCLFACKGCYNKLIQNFNYGVDYTPELEERIIQDLDHDYVQGLTLLGGEPFLSTPVLLPLVQKVRKVYGSRKDIWAWSGYYFEELLRESEDKLDLLSQLDVLVDGRFDQSLKDLSLQFRGSSNQRIIDVPASLAGQSVQLWKEGKYK